MTVSNDWLAWAIHYPICWDTAAYPFLTDALCELEAFSHHPEIISSGWCCQNPECPFRENYK